MNTSLCSNGEKITQSQINTRRSATYKALYIDNPNPMCRGCQKCKAQGTAHLIPQSRAKWLGKSELCWLPINMVPACHTCNAILENVSSEDFKNLLCYDYVVEILKQYDYERYTKATI